jgi:hypothetical protein
MLIDDGVTFSIVILHFHYSRTLKSKALVYSIVLAGPLASIGSCLKWLILLMISLNPDNWFKPTLSSSSPS